jgi:hypothetical protein
MYVVPSAAQIKTELDADPQALGYAALRAAQDWNGLTTLLNQVRPQGDPKRETVDRRMIDRQEVIEALVYAEVVTNTAAAGTAMRDALTLLLVSLNGGFLDPLNANIRGFFTGAFAAGTATRTNLVALQTRPGSRAEKLWGDGVRVSASLVEDAVRLP